MTGADEFNGGDHVVRSTDMGKTWHDITNNAGGSFKGLTPDPDHPGLVRIHAYSLRPYTLVADDENYRWRTVRDNVRPAGRRPRDAFFARDASSSTTFYLYQATLANYFRYDFGNATSDHAIEAVAAGTRFEFARCPGRGPDPRRLPLRPRYRAAGLAARARGRRPRRAEADHSADEVRRPASRGRLLGPPCRIVRGPVREIPARPPLSHDDRDNDTGR